MELRRFSSPGFDRGAPRWKEGLWWLVRAALFLHSLPLPSALKAASLRAFGAKLGARPVIRSFVNITFPWRFRAGDDVWLGDGVFVLSLAPVELGSDVCISQRAFLCTGSHDYRSETFDLVARPIRVGDGSWVAAAAFIGPGVTVGAGSVVGAGAVVMRDVPPGSLAFGNPVRTKPKGRPEPVS